MSRRSLRLRLLLAAAVSIALALVVAGFVWVRLFERHVERRLHDELEIHLQQLAANVAFAPDGKLRLKQQLADPRFSKVYGGLYWQIVDGDKIALRSRSLWDSVLPLPDDPLNLGAIHEHDIPGPQGTTLLVREQSLVYTTAAGPRTVPAPPAPARARASTGQPPSPPRPSACGTHPCCRTVTSPAPPAPRTWPATPADPAANRARCE